MENAGGISAPAHLTPAHNLEAFNSGVPALDDWLKRRAIANEKSGASRTYVVTAEGRVVAYYALAAGAVAQPSATTRARRNMPAQVPVMVLGRLAVDIAYQGRGLGQGLLRDAILRTLQAAEIGGIRAILVHAISEEAKRFYLRHGFVESPVAPMTLMITIADARRALTRPDR
ncbi:MAG: GNAT family N-acetyltransferase [Candidatus Rokubacteria bacterium]|nr:GNAT family N-acetyltransferase [Candidatus Rokubacteria bacterium]